MIKNKAAITMAILMGIISLNLWLYLGFADYSSIATENAKHLLKAYEISQRIEQGVPLNKALNTITYPPLFYIPAAMLFIACSARTESLAVLSILPFILLTMGSTYLIARMAADKISSVTAAFAAASLMSVSLRWEGYIIEYALTAFVMLSLWLFLKSSKCLDSKYSLLFGISAGFSLLTKWTSPAYFIVPAFLTLAAIASDRQNRAKRIRNAALAISAAFFIAQSWYLAYQKNTQNFKETFNHFSHSRSTEIEMLTSGTTDPGARQKVSGIMRFGPAALTAFLVTKIIPPHLSFLFVFGLVCYFMKRFSERKTILTELFLIFLIPSILFCFYPAQKLFVPEKTLRHLAPIFPLFLITGTYWCSKLKLGWTALAACVTISAISIFNWCFPNMGIFSSSLLVGENLCSINHFSFADPLGICGKIKKNSMETLAADLADKYQKGYMPIFEFSNTFEDFQPLLAEFYAAAGQVPVMVKVQGTVKTVDSRSQIHERGDRTYLDPNGKRIEVTQYFEALDSLESKNNYLSHNQTEYSCIIDESPQVRIYQLMRTTGLDKYRTTAIDI